MALLRRTIATLIVIFAVLWGFFIVAIPSIIAVILLYSLEALFQMAETIDPDGDPVT